MSPTNSFWKTIPRTSLVGFLLGVFFIFSTMGLAADVIEMGRQPTLRFALGVLLSGFFAMFYAFTGFVLRKQFWKAFVPVLAVHLALMYLLARSLPDLPQSVPVGAAEIARLQSRLALSGIATILAIGLGYGCFLYSSITAGRRYFREHAEIELAAEIHHVLVPAIDAQIAGYEFYGRSLPSGEVGGDLIDLAGAEDHWVAYVADVSGHGVAPGVVMGMVKSAARMQLSSGEKRSELLERLNSVLRPIKKPEMFATFAYVAWNGERLEYSSAGHPPILHYHDATGEISELACPNLPLGLLDGRRFVNESVDCAPNDLFVLLTDGLLETTNTQDEEFSLSGVKAVLSAQAGRSTSAVFEALLAAAHRHGHSVDDLSLLLIR